MTVERTTTARASRPAGYAARRAARRGAAALRLVAQARRPLDRPPPDPLARPPRSRWRSTGVVVALAALSLAVHVGGVLLAHGVGQLFGRYRMPGDLRADERVAIEVREVPRPAPVVPEPPPAPAPLPVVAAPRPAPQPAQPPPADPIDTPPPPPAPVAEPPPAPRRRVVGISYESTVAGGGGPALAVGNTRMGQAAPTAVEPSAVEKLAPEPNQRAAVVPTTGVTLSKPVRLSQAPPPYPEALRARGLEADVVVLVDIAPDGAVTRVSILRPAAEPEFNEAAAQAARAERFTPATRDGTPIAYTLKFTYRFRLGEA